MYYKKTLKNYYVNQLKKYLFYSKIECMERIDDLQFKNLKIIQDSSGFRFGIDSVLLSDFARDIRFDSKIVDLGTGTGIIGILLTGKVRPRK